MVEAEVMRDFVSPKVYKRGIKYYKNGCIKNYRVKKSNLDDKSFLISAVVSGTRDYEIDCYLELLENDIYLDSSCSCPYDWEEHCKHEVAVVHKFLTEDQKTLPKKNISASNKFKEADQAARDYQKLLDVSQKYLRSKDKVLAYQVKGLIDQDIKNFKLSLFSEELTDFQINDIVAGLNGEVYNLYYQEIIDNNFFGEELELLEELSKLDKSRTRSQNSLLLTKNKTNFYFLLKLIDNYEVSFSENGLIAARGEILQPEIKLKGNLEEVKFKINTKEYPIYKSGEDNLSWTVIESKVHLLELSLINELSKKVKIPEEKQGEFLFEIIPALKKNMQLEVNSDLEEHKLIKEEAAVKLKLDYNDEKIAAQIEVSFAGENYANAEILGLDAKTAVYTKHKDKAKVWATRDNSIFAEIIDFLEEYNFKVRPNDFVVKGYEDIQYFITDGLLHIPEEWEVLSTESFNEMEVKEIELEPIIQIDDGEGINWFDFKVSYNLGGQTFSRQELMQMINYNKSGEAYVKLENKFFVLERGEKEEKLDKMIEQSEKNDDQSYRSPYHNILYYFNLAEEAGINFKSDGVYNQLQEDISNQKAVEEKELPQEVNEIMRNYQKEGYYWLNFLHKYHFGGILADDMGLGKTLQLLTLLKGLAPEKPALAVCPRTLIYNWQEEANKFFSDLSTFVYYGTPDERDEMRKKFSDYDLIITSYSILSRDIDKINEEEQLFSLAVLDEAQHIKNHKTKRAQAVKDINAETRLALTGTPLENSISELWSIFDFLMPGYLGNYSYFNKNYQLPITKNNNQQKMKHLKERVAPFILRRRKEEVLKELPEKIINIHSVSMTQLQEDSYKLVLDEVKGKLMERIKDKGFDRSRINVLAALTKLRQICNHPALVLDEKGLEQSSGKLESLMELVDDALSSGRKIIIFSQFVKMLKLIRKSFAKRNIDYQYLDGSTRNRMERVNEFNNNQDLRVFLISLKAGGVGLNLNTADMVIHVDPWWNPMVERQATDRAHRFGQENRVMVYKLITRGTVEEKILKLQKKKQDVFDNIIEDNVNPIQAVTWEDIQELLEYQ